MKCLNCGKEFESKRSTAKYCSAACRVAVSRLSATNEVSVTDSVTPVSVTKLSVTDVSVPVSVTNVPEPKTIEDVIALTAGEAQAVLDQWLVSGTPYQRRLAALDRAYTFIYG